ncbi:MAG: nucleotidyltransferase family protein [Spirochaetales bacterium]|nr:MAG: nucleotidyltransferase family protein [Spirochaetales bacterium]
MQGNYTIPSIQYTVNTVDGKAGPSRIIWARGVDRDVADADTCAMDTLRQHAGGSAPVCVIPAAGRSSRMKGCPAGDFKPLLPWRGEPMCAAVARAALAAGCLPLLVTGYRGDELEAALSGLQGLVFVRNDAWEAGMLGSICTGAGAAGSFDPQGTGFLVAPADMPFIPVTAFAAILAAVRNRSAENAEPAALFPTRNGRLGHPVWIPYAFLPGLMKLEADGRLRDSLLSREWAGVEVESDAIFVDVDTPAEYEATVATMRD